MSVFGGTINPSEISKLSGWTYYKPQITTAGISIGVTNPTGRYFTLGKLVYVQIAFTLNTLNPANATVDVSLPFLPEAKASANQFSDFLPGTVGYVNINEYNPTRNKRYPIVTYTGGNLPTGGSLLAYAGWYVKS